MREDSGAGLIHPEAVKAAPGRVERPVAGRGSLGGRGRAHRLAAARATAEDLARIRAAMTAMQENAADLPAFIRADFEFHLAIADASHNELLAQFYHLTRTLLKK